MDIKSEVDVEEFLDPLEAADDVDFLDEMAPLEPVEDTGVRQLYIPKSCLTAGQVVNILRRMLRSMNSSYIDIAERTAFCAIKLYDYAKLNSRSEMDDIDRNSLILLSLLFTIGAYRDDFFANLEKTEKSENISNVFLYSYLYLKHLTPLGDIAEAIIFYNYEWDKARIISGQYAEYASLVFTCMRICIELRKTKYVMPSGSLTKEFVQKCHAMYNPIYIDLFIEANRDAVITKDLEDNSHYMLLDEYCNSLHFDYGDTFALLKLLIYSIDFRSTSTVTHIISTSFLSTELCRLCNFSDTETDEVFTAAILHDLGKMAIDVDILECAGKLSEIQMEKMRSHVKEGDYIYRSIVGDKIADIASSHHETLDGKGYPKGLTEKDLSIQQRVLSVADVFSALTDARTYKPPFPKEKTLEILESMSNNHKIDSSVFAHVKEKYDEIKAHAEIRRPMLTVNLGKVILEYMKLQDCKTVPELIQMLGTEE
ncbi:HD-GYP domain-containing protein [Treponema sp.]|uniref:HD-GYP domain-containing protein n=1 Tax=Treponema sp. TaxID=166 RepID=UPI00298E1A9A|nr:HD domain-containing phosphohydrolase [Treponema sp.]MCR5614106.1 HD domain-containing protein [Treponema sp.]